jgi:hypothetical protein
MHRLCTGNKGQVAVKIPQYVIPDGLVILRYKLIDVEREMMLQQDVPAESHSQFKIFSSLWKRLLDVFILIEPI